MNVGGSSSFNEIKYARPLKGKAGVGIEDQNRTSLSRDSLKVISRDQHSEFSPIRVLEKLEATGNIDSSLLEPYKNASFDRVEALRLKREIFDPVVNYAKNSGRDVDQVKQELKNAILSHIDLSSARLRQVPSSTDPTISHKEYALAA